MMRQVVAGGLALVLAGGVLVVVAGSSTRACTPGGAAAPVSADAGEGQTVAGYSGEQLQNAAAIMTAAAKLGLTEQAQRIGVMTAMGESGLRVLDRGDAAGPDSRGLFQQRGNGAWGSYEDRMNPEISATNFFKAMIRVAPDYETMPPSAVAHAVQRNADPNHYTRWIPAANEVVDALSNGSVELAAACTSGAGGPVSADQVALAKEIIDAEQAGKITHLTPNHLDQVRSIAAGQTVDGCGVDVGILQTIAVAYRTFGQIGVSSINRHCTGQTPGAGTASYHYRDGGGHAVDFYSLGGKATTGADANAIRLINTLNGMVPADSFVGQVQCRAKAGTSLTLSNFGQFNDTCNHLHIEIRSKQPLKGSNDA